MTTHLRDWLPTVASPLLPSPIAPRWSSPVPPTYRLLLRADAGDAAGTLVERWGDAGRTQGGRKERHSGGVCGGSGGGGGGGSVMLC